MSFFCFQFHFKQITLEPPCASHEKQGIQIEKPIDFSVIGEEVVTREEIIIKEDHHVTKNATITKIHKKRQEELETIKSIDKKILHDTRSLLSILLKTQSIGSQRT